MPRSCAVRKIANFKTTGSVLNIQIQQRQRLGYKSNPHTLDEHVNTTRKRITKTSEEELQRVNKNVFSRLNAC
jgi:hypothetical protein